MFVRCLVIVCCAIIRLASGYYTASERGVLSGIFNDKPSTVLNQWIGPAEIDDGCEREYPLSPDNNRAVDLAYSRYNLVPQILPFSPPTYLEVEYDDLPNCQPKLGNEVDVCGLSKPPSRVYWQCNSSKRYALLLVDLYPLGIKNAPLLQYGILWLVVNIPGCNIDAGKTIYEYQQPLPLYGSGKNRYAFAIFEQPKYEVDWSAEQFVSATSENRYYICTSIVLKYNLNFFAGNFFTSHFKPCLEDALEKLDEPSPQYVTKSEEQANLPANPYK